jgi:hypothetical protein
MEAGIKEISKCVALPDHHGIEKAEDEILGLQSLTIEDICRKAASSLREAVRSLQEGSTDWAKAEAELGYACLLLAGFAEEAAAPSKDQRTPGGLIASQYDLMKEAAAAYQAALQVFTIERDRTFFGELHKDLAVVYSMIASDSIKPDSEAMEMFAVSSCQQALKIYSSTDHPLEHAEIQNMLGLALGAVLRHHIGADRLMLALAASAAFREAGRIMLQHCQLEEHAQARSRLAQSLMILSVIEEDEGASMTAREKTLNEAVLAISDAAGIFSPNVHLAEYASLMRRLGMAYRSLTQLYSLMIEEAETDGLSDKDVAKKESKEKALEGNRLELTQDRRTNTNKKVKMDFKTDSESDRKKTRADARIAANEAERKGQRRRDVLKLRDVRQDYCKQAIRSYKKAIRSFNEAIDRLPQSDAERDELKAMVKDCLFGAESCRSIMRGIKG